MDKSPDDYVRLPELEEVTALFREVFEQRLHERTRSDGFLSLIKTHIMHEGASGQIIRAENDTDDVDLVSAQAELQIPNAEVNSFNEERAIKEIDKIAEQFKKEQSRIVLAKIDQTVEKTGNVIKGDGHLSHEGLYAALEKVDQNFKSGPDHSDMVIVMSPEMQERALALNDEFQNSKELREKFLKLRERKYEQFRDREMDRTLAG